MKPFILLILLPLLLAGCATPPPPASGISSEISPEPSAQATREEWDPLRKTLTVRASPIRFERPPTRGACWLQVVGQRDQEARMQLIIRTFRPVESRFAVWREAHDVGGTPLRVAWLNMELDSSLLREGAQIQLDREYLEQHVDSGLQLRLEGERARLLVELPPEYIQQFLGALEEENRPNLFSFRLRTGQSRLPN